MTNTAPRRDHNIVDGDGRMTRRFSEYLESLNRDVNQTGSAVPVDPAVAFTFNLQAQIGSGEPLTWDETGFTWDSDKLSFDQTEA